MVKWGSLKGLIWISDFSDDFTSKKFQKGTYNARIQYDHDEDDTDKASLILDNIYV